MEEALPVPLRTWPEMLAQPIVPSLQRAPIYNREGGIGNIPAAIINNLPIPQFFNALKNTVKTGESVYDWATTSEGAAQAAPGGAAPATAPVRAAPATIQNIPGQTLPAAAAVSGPAPSGGLTSRPASYYRPIIKGIESQGSGDYSALGPLTGGDRAYGAYGVMGANIPSWTQEALGRTLTPEEFLASPEAQDAVFDYRFGQYLAQTGSPDDAASMWFTGRPLAEAYGASDVLGTSGEEYVNKFRRLSGQAQLPPSAQPYEMGAPPQYPNPADRPLPAQPDFSRVNELVSQAAPQPPVPQDRFMALLNGLAQANAGVDTRGPGGFARLMGAWGAGATGAAQSFEDEEAAAEAAFQDEQRRFLLTQAQIASNQEGALRDWRNLSGDIGFENQTADQQAAFKNQTSAYEVGEANRKMGFEAGQVNRERLYEFGEAQRAANQPKVLHASDKGVTIQYPDGRIENRPMGVANYDPDAPDPVKEAQLYSALVEQGNPQAIKEEGLKEAVREGTARSIFGPEIYDQILEEVISTIEAPLMADADAYEKAVQNGVAAKLMELTLNDESWLPNAAMMGNRGARVYLSLQQQGMQ